MEHASRFKGVIALVGILLAIFLAVKSWEIVRDLRRPDLQGPTITVSGEGKVFAKPDIGKITLAVRSEAETVEEAQARAAEVINNIFEMLKENGVEEKDIKTTNFSISPQYDFPKGRRRLLGYFVSQSLEVKIRDLSEVGEIIAGAAENGANQVGGLSFTTEDLSAIQQEARDKAIEDAQKKAEALARKLGVRLGKVVGFSEFGGPRPIPVSFLSLESRVGGAPVPEIPTGENEIRANVNVTYQIK